MTELSALLITAVSLALFHTVIGVDHYLPFVALSRANGWTMRKTLLIVFACGAGHVLSSVLLGFIGIALSSGVTALADIEDIRGEIATCFLIAFGLAYTIYGIRSAVKNKIHSHISPDGQTVTHAHSGSGEGHKHRRGGKANLFWGLFVLFVLGPCEPLIPLLMYPAATLNVPALVLVTAVFAAGTIGTMLLMTFLGIKGIRLLKITGLERYSHAMAGSAILICGVSLLLLPI